MFQSKTTLPLLLACVLSGAQTFAIPKLDCDIRPPLKKSPLAIRRVAANQNDFKPQKCDQLTGELAEFAEAIAKVEQATVTMWCRANGKPMDLMNLEKLKKENEIFVGNAVFVQDQSTLATVRHNLDAQEGKGFIRNGKPTPWVGADSCVISDKDGNVRKLSKVHHYEAGNSVGDQIEGDVAILKIAEPATNIEPLDFYSGPMAEGDQVIMLSRVRRKKENGVGTRDCGVRLGIVADHFEAGKANGAFSYGGTSQKGNSGGPIFTPEGELKGFHQKTQVSPSGGVDVPWAIQIGEDFTHWDKNFDGGTDSFYGN